MPSRKRAVKQQERPVLGETHRQALRRAEHEAGVKHGKLLSEAAAAYEDFKQASAALAAYDAEVERQAKERERPLSAQEQQVRASFAGEGKP